MTRIMLSLFLLMSFSIGVSGQSLTTQQQIYGARDKVYPALVHIQPVIQDFNTE